MYKRQELYKEGLEKELLLEQGRLSRFSYHNIVGTGLRSGQYEWTENFINTYKNTLEKQYRESSYSFNLARLAYSRQDYNETLSLLQKSNYRDLLLNLSAKTLLLKTYCELEEIDLLFSHLDAMQKYIRRKKVIGYHKTNYLNIIHFARRLITINKFDKTELNILAVAIKEEEILSEKQWFLKQLN